MPPIPGARGYATEEAIFLTRVRIEQQLAGEKPYSYALGNPTTYVDPTGDQAHAGHPPYGSGTDNRGRPALPPGQSYSNNCCKYYGTRNKQLGWTAQSVYDYFRDMRDCGPMDYKRDPANHCAPRPSV
jgi:hypothetical protein